MALQKCGLILGHDFQELAPHGTPEFPCAGYLAHYTDRPEDVVAWHWHKELEILYVKSGELKLQIPAKTFFLKAGDCAVVNINLLHYAAAKPQCELHSLVFSPLLLTGANESAFAKKYLTPLTDCTSFDGYLLGAARDKAPIQAFISAFEALASEPTAYEFIVRENLSAFCLFLFEHFSKEIAAGGTPLSHDRTRIRKMLDYIHTNLSASLSLSEIARAADIGERECMRCFQRTIQISPMQYLLKYRIMQGASYLLQNPEDNITEISTLCGFDSPSHFSKIFKRFYNCTPSTYRNRNH